MARQRFIWPDIWKDPVFGRLSAEEQVFFIGCFSIADDEGRLNADPAFLRGELFTYKDLSLKKVQAVRDAVVQKCVHVHLYQADGNDYIALLRWSEYQKPKYPKPSKLPAPFLEGALPIPKSSPKLSGSLPENGAAGRVGQGRDGLGRAGLGWSDVPAIQVIDQDQVERKVDDMLDCANDVREDSKGRVMMLALRLPESSLAKVLESCESRRKAIGVGYVVNALKSELEERAA